MKIALYVQHLLGTGHLVRTRLLADALYEAGHRVTLISGGPIGEPPRYPAIQLPIVKTTQTDFSTLLDEDGKPVTEQFKNLRTRQLVAAVEGLTPDVVVIETWPFGRKQMEFEILPMVDTLRHEAHPPLIVCSIRDVLQERKPSRRLRSLEQLKAYFGLVLVHGDARLIPLDSSFPEAGEIPCPVAYTGYITPSKGFCAEGRRVTERENSGEVVVSAGGGAAGLTLLNVAKLACEEGAKTHARVWRLLVGPNLGESHFQALKDSDCPQLVVERNRKDFLDLLRRADVSVSQFGYNTALDIAGAGCKAVAVPFEGDGETEQLMRARCFARQGRIEVLREQDLSVENLTAATNKAGRLNLTNLDPIDISGTRRSVDFIQQAYSRRC